MGGIGSGAYGSGKLKARQTTDASFHLDIRYLFRDVQIKPGEPHKLRWLDYRDKTETFSITCLLVNEREMQLDFYTCTGKNSQTLHIEWMPCTYGGSRAYFKCSDCLRKAAVIYRPSDKQMFLCWRCHDLRYRSSQLSRNHLRTANRKIRSLLERVGCEFDPSLSYQYFDKPKGMHQRTYDKLRWQYYQLMEMKLDALGGYPK